MRHPIYLGYGLLLLVLTTWAEYRGWSPLRVNEVKSIPRTVRDNPGVYRSVYRGFPHYIGGK